MARTHSFVLILAAVCLLSSGTALAGPPPAEPEQKPTAAHGCESSSVFCLNWDGQPYDDSLPGNMEQGTEITVLVLDCPRSKNAKFTIAGSLGKSPDQLFRAENTVALTSQTTCRVEILHSVRLTIPESFSYTIAFERLDEGATTPVSASYTTRVLRGLYFIDFTFGPVLVFDGKRELVRRPDGMGGQQLALEETFLVEPTLMLNVFPGGRRLGAISSFKAENVGRGFANSLGVQVGLGLDLSKFGERFFLGGFFEPITGLNISAGVALIQGDFLNPSFQIGQTVDPTTDAGDWTRRRFMARPYIAIGFSFDIFRNLQGAGKNDVVTSFGKG